MKLQSLTVKVMEGLHIFFYFPLGLEVRARARVVDYFARKGNISIINVCNKVCRLIAGSPPYAKCSLRSYEREANSEHFP